MIPLAIDRIKAHILEHVVHPAHVPLVIEAHTTHIYRLGNQRPSRRFLGNHECLWMILENSLIELAQEIHGFEIARIAVFIRLPLAIFAPIVQIQHIGNRIDTQPIDMELFKPEHGIGNQEALNLRAAIIEVRRTPFPVLGALLVVRLIKRLSIEVAQSLLIFAKMSRYPVHDDSDAILMCLVNEITEIIRLTVAARHRKISRSLIPPGTIERMLTERHELNMRIVHFLRIADKLIC